MANIDLEALRGRIRSMSFERGTPEQIALWREDIEESRASLVIEDMTPIEDEDAMFVMMLDEGVPPSLMPSIILGSTVRQRYRVTLAKAREELERYLPTARQQAADRLRSLIKEGAPSTVIANALTELAYVRHAKGSINRPSSPILASARSTPS